MFRKCWFLLSLYFDVDDDHHHHHHHPVITFLSPAPFDSVSPSLRETLCSLGSWGTTHASSPGCFLLIAPPSFSWNSYMLCSPSTAHCSSHSWVMSPSLTIQIIPHMLMATPVCRCQTHLSSPGPHRFQRCPRGCSRRVSTWWPQIIQKETHRLPSKSPSPPPPSCPSWEGIFTSCHPS